MTQGDDERKLNKKRVEQENTKKEVEEKSTTTDGLRKRKAKTAENVGASDVTVVKNHEEKSKRKKGMNKAPASGSESECSSPGSMATESRS